MSSASVVIVSYHTGSVLTTALASVLGQRGLANVVIVDNGNPPDVLARLQQMALMDERIVVMTGHGNIGFAAACNLGATKATGEYLLLLNPDCILPPNALLTLVQEINKLPGTMLAGVHLVNPDGSEQRGGRRNLLTPGSALGEMLGFGRLNMHKQPMPSETHDVPAISGACMFIRAADYAAIGGMDEGYFLHVEDLDLCMRVSRLGKRIVCVPSITIAHLLSTSGGSGRALVEYHKAKGFVRYFWKFYSGPLLPLLKAGIWTRFRLRRLVPSRESNKKLAASQKLMALASCLTTAPVAPSLAGKTVLVIGATSQVGVEIIRHLLASGAAVLAVSREQPLPFAHPNLRWLKKDITHESFSLDDYLADVAIHAAPQWYLPKILPVLAASEVKRVVSIGSTSIFSKASSHNPYEKDIVAKHARAEHEIAAISAANGMGWTILRPTMIYGLGLDRNISSLARIIDRYGRVAVYPPAIGRRQPVHAEDVALAALQAVGSENAVNKSYNISGGEILTYREMLLRIFDVLRKPPKIIETSALPLILRLIGIFTGRKHVTGDIATRMNEDLVFFMMTRRVTLATIRAHF